MNIIFILSLICLIILFILIKKSDKKLDILSFIGITLVLTMCYNVFVAYVFTYFKIPITLLNLSILNFGISLLLSFKIIIKKEIQKYEINKMDILFISIIAIGVGIVSYFEFGFPFNIKYETSDAAIHYQAPVMFSKEKSLLIGQGDSFYGNFGFFKPGSYVNSGLLMKIFSSYIGEIEYYNIFIAFGIFILFLTGTVMYNSIVKFSKNNKTRFLACILSLIYVLGYPLNSLLFGFEYLSMAILIICTIIEMTYYHKNFELKEIYNIIIFFLLDFQLFLSYYTFVPFVYSTLWIYFCIESYRKNNKFKDIFNKNNILILVLTLLLPFVLGYIYQMAPNIYKKTSSQIITNTAKALTSTSTLSTPGYIYINFYSNIILFLPLTLYVIKKEYKKNNFDFMMLLFLVGYISLLFIGYVFNKVSAYYLCKNYYILWGLLIYENFKGLMYLYDNDKQDPFICVIAYIILIIIGLTFTKVERIEGNTNSGENILKVTDIYGDNKTIIKETWIIYTQEEIEILKYVRDNIVNDKKVIQILGNKHQLLWGYPLLNYNNKFITNGTNGHFALIKTLINIEQNMEYFDYLVYFNRSTFYDYYSKKLDLMKNGEVIYHNNAGGVIKYYR